MIAQTGNSVSRIQCADIRDWRYSTAHATQREDHRQVPQRCSCIVEIL